MSVAINTKLISASCLKGVLWGSGILCFFFNKKNICLGIRFGWVWDGLRGRESIPGCPGGVFERFSYFPRGFPEFSNLTHGDLSIAGLSHQAISKDRSHCCMNDEKFENLQKRCETYGDSQETIKNRSIWKNRQSLISGQLFYRSWEDGIAMDDFTFYRAAPRS